MMKNKLLAGFLFLSALFFSTAYALPVNVLRMTIPASPVSFITASISETLEANGYEVKNVGLKSCQGGYQWHLEHKNEKAVFVLYANYVIPNLLDPKNKLGCYFSIDEQNLVQTIGSYWWYMCGRSENHPTLEKFLKEDKPTVSIWGYPIVVGAVQKIFNHLHSNAKIVGTPSGGSAIELFQTKDVDYYMGVTKGTIASLKDATCFATSASVANAKEYMPGFTSFQSVDPKVPFVNFGMDPMIIALNFTPEELEKLRSVFKNYPSKNFEKIKESFVPNNLSISEQVAQIKQDAKDLK